MESRPSFTSGVLLGLAAGAILGIAGTLLIGSPPAPIEPNEPERRAGLAEPGADERPVERTPAGEAGDAPSEPAETGEPAVTDEPNEAGEPSATDDTTEAGDADLAARIERLERAIAATPNDPRTIREYVDATAEAGTPTAAVAFFEKLLAADPQNVELMVGLGMSATREAGRLSEQGAAGMMEAGKFAFQAREVFGKAIELDDDHEAARLNRAVLGVYSPSFLRWHQQAEVDLNHLIKAQQGRATENGAAPFVHLAELYRRTNRLEDAKRTLEEGLQRYPAEDRLRARLEALRAEDE